MSDPDKEVLFRLRQFYGYLWDEVDALYPGYAAAVGGPRKNEDAASVDKSVDKAESLSNELSGDLRISSELARKLENDIALVRGILHRHTMLQQSQKAQFLKSHELDRENLLREVESYSEQSVAE